MAKMKAAMAAVLVIESCAVEIDASSDLTARAFARAFHAHASSKNWRLAETFPSEESHFSPPSHSISHPRSHDEFQ